MRLRSQAAAWTAQSLSVGLVACRASFRGKIPPDTLELSLSPQNRWTQSAVHYDMTKHVSRSNPALNYRSLARLQQMLGLIVVASTDDKFRDVVFVCIDCEAYERNQNWITEIGISVLDTRVIADVPADSDGQPWLSRMEYAHFRPIEYRRFKNTRFVKGCPESFQFGPTTWIRRDDAKHVLRRIFEDPTNLSSAADFSAPVSPERRNVVLVGHSIGSDADHLKHVGFALNQVTNIVHRVDTQRLVSTKKAQIGLHRLLLALNLQPKDLHNAGNDAAYTLQAMVTIAVKERVAPTSVHAALLNIPHGKLAPVELTGLKAPEVWSGTTRRSQLD